jgi:hypothetical protein
MPTKSKPNKRTTGATAPNNSKRARTTSKGGSKYHAAVNNKKKNWGSVYSTNQVFPDLPPVSLNENQEHRLRLAVAALPPDLPAACMNFRIKMLRQLIHKQAHTTSKIGPRDKHIFEEWMSKIRHAMYQLNLPEYAEYAYIVLIQTQIGTKHLFVYTLCPTSPKKDIPSLDISMLGSSDASGSIDQLTNTNTVRFLQKLGEVLYAHTKIYARTRTLNSLSMKIITFLLRLSLRSFLLRHLHRMLLKIRCI